MYVPPSAPSIAGFLGDAHAGKYSHSHSQLTRKGSVVVLAKSYTSDDELDELDSPLSSLITTPCSPPSTNLNWTSKGNTGPHALRYQLLRELWKNND